MAGTRAPNRGYGDRPFGTPAIGDDPVDVVCWVNEDHWDRWEPAYRPYWNQIEENIRMLSGRQYEVFIESMGEFLPIDSWFLTDDERWRRYPVFNWVAHHFKMTLSKLTENPVGIGYVPTTADERAAALARLMEPVFKRYWRTMAIPELAFDLYGWVVCAARGILTTFWNADLGPEEEWLQDAVISMLGPNGIEQRQVAQAPFMRVGEYAVPALMSEGMAMDGRMPLLDHQGNPVALPGPNGLPQFGPPNKHRLGDLDAEVNAPTSMIVPHGPQRFERKPWYCHEFLMHVDDVEARYGIEVEPGLPGAGRGGINSKSRYKFEYGTNYGMPSLSGLAFAGGMSQIQDVVLEGMVACRALWVRDKPGDPNHHKGRLTIVTAPSDTKGGQLLEDMINPYWVDGWREKAVIPFHAFDLIKFPFRQEGHTDYEILNPIARATNRVMGSALDSSDYNAHTPLVIDRDSDIDDDFDEMNRPDGVIRITKRPGVPAVERVPPSEAYRGQLEISQVLQNWMQLLGSQPLASEGKPATEDASGELQREVRFDTDRVWGATLRSHSFVWGRVSLTMKDIIAACLTDERILTLAGEDQAYDFLMLRRELFLADIDAIPSPESLVLESRQDKQNRILLLKREGVLTDPVQILEAMNQPDLARLVRPGGPAYSMAQRENLEMALGAFPPVLQEHDHTTHLLVHRQRQQSIDYRNAPDDLKARFRTHIALHEQMGALEMMRQMAMATTVASAGMPGGPGAPAAAARPAPGGDSGAGNPSASPDLEQNPQKAPRAADLREGRSTPGEADPRRRAALSLKR